jgi:hypothetical protein
VRCSLKERERTYSRLELLLAGIMLGFRKSVLAGEDTNGIRVGMRLETR